MSNDDDSEYISGEDSDFKDGHAISNSGSSDDSDLETPKKKRKITLDEGDLAAIATAEHDKNDVDSGDLILTRAQKRRKWV
jgi:hypothetical protein